MTLDDIEMNKSDEKGECKSTGKGEDSALKQQSPTALDNGSKSERSVIRIGSRKSKLAIVQAECVIKLLNEIFNAKEVIYKFELSTISTKGDKILDVPLANIGSKALFTKELEVALLDNEIDLIVHSCKDLPTNLPAGLCISALIRCVLYMIMFNDEPHQSNSIPVFCCLAEQHSVNTIVI